MLQSQSVRWTEACWLGVFSMRKKRLMFAVKSSLDGTGAARGKSEGVCGQTVPRAAGVVGEQAVEGVELRAVRPIAGRHQTTFSPRRETCLHSHSLRVRPDVVDDDSPLTLGVSQSHRTYKLHLYCTSKFEMSLTRFMSPWMGREILGSCPSVVGRRQTYSHECN